MVLDFDKQSRAVLIDRLEIAKRNVATGAEHIAHQKRLIGKLRDAGGATGTAQRILRALENAQAMYIENRDALEHELATANPE